MFIPFSSSPFHPLINWLDTTGFSNLMTSYSIFVLPIISLSNFISFASNICLVFYVSVLVSRAYVIIGCTDALYIFDLVSFLIYLFLQTRSFKQPATLAAFWAWVLIYFTRFPELAIFTPKQLNFITCSTIFPWISNL